MDKQFKFNLDVAIANYIEKINSSLALDTDDIKELEDHLHTSVQEIKLENKLLDGEAFTVAINRLGSHQELRQQYADSSPWRPIIRFSIIGLFFYGLLRGIILLCTGLTMLFMNFEFSTYFIEIDPAHATIIQSVLFIALLFLGIRIFKKVVTKSTNQQLNILISMLVLVFSLELFTIFFAIHEFHDPLNMFLLFSSISGSLLYLFLSFVMIGYSLYFKFNKRALSLA